jgi:hypothetical protein
MPNTYVALRTETVTGSPASSVTFSLSGISGYTDLVLVCNAKVTTGTPTIRLQFNSDTGSNYSATILYGDGSSAGSVRVSSQASINQGLCTTEFGTTQIHLMNYSNATTNKTTLCNYRNIGPTYGEAGAIAGLWRNTAAITSITIFPASSTFATGSTFSLYGIANADQGAAKATGGIITEDANYWYHTFGASGAFIPKQSLTCDVLVVAGGGGGGSYRAGGGGAGGLLLYSAQSLTAISHTVTVGAGGTGATQSGVFAVGAVGTSGVNSQFASLTAATGGGRGGAPNGGTAGAAGGSGGGSCADPSFSPNAGGAASPSGQGNAGGASNSFASPYYGAGGGGGAGAVGSNGTSAGGGGAGGIGSSAYSSWGIATGTGQNSSGTYYYAGGGAGGEFTGIASTTAKSGGLGGGGSTVATTTATASNGGAGTVNTGGGGAGSVSTDNGGAMGNGGAGGSGIVIVRYAK